MARHMKEVHGDKTYQCEQCFKSYATPWILKCHFKVVHGPKLFGCEICNKKFADISKLNAHKKTHLEVKSFIEPPLFSLNTSRLLSSTVVISFTGLYISPRKGNFCGMNLKIIKTFSTFFLHFFLCLWLNCNIST